MSKTNKLTYEHQRVGVFVDVQNMYYSARHLYDSNVNFGEILRSAVGNRQLIRAIAYVIRAEMPKEQTFWDALEREGFEAKIKDIQIFPGGIKKGDWDVGITVDAIKLAPRLDAVVLVTGDGDHIPLVNYLQEHDGCRVEVIAFGRSASSKLKEEADSFLNLDENSEKYLYKPRG